MLQAGARPPQAPAALTHSALSFSPHTGIGSFFFPIPYFQAVKIMVYNYAERAKEHGKTIRQSVYLQKHR